MMMRLMFIVVCGVASCWLKLAVLRRGGLGQALLPLILSRNLSIPELERKIGAHCNFSFRTGNAVLRLTRRKEAAVQEPRDMPRRVEDLIGGGPTGAGA